MPHSLLGKIAAGLCLLAPALLLPAPPVSKALDGRPLDTPPHMLGVGKGQYPEEMTRRNKFFSGFVTVEFTVTEEGKMEAPRVVQNSHIGFVPATIDLLRACGYAPGMIDGKAVASQLRITVPFDGSDGAFAGGWPYKVSAKSPAEYPPELRYDYAPNIMTVCDPVYPAELLRAGTRGKARVRYLLDPTGRVSAAEVVSATSPEFGASLVAAVETWRFTPATLKGKPTTTLLTHDYEFVPKLFLADQGEQRVLDLLKDKPAAIADAASLDEKPRLFYQVAAQYPRALEPQHTKGEAEVEFVVDHNGRVRQPRIISATRPEFGWAAVTAVQQWLYDHPKVQGKDADVRMRTTLPFSP